jgi:hypothetical protein
MDAALAYCKAQHPTLVITKSDRLAPNLHFLTGLIDTDVDFVWRHTLSAQFKSWAVAEA